MLKPLIFILKQFMVLNLKILKQFNKSML